MIEIYRDLQGRVLKHRLAQREYLDRPEKFSLPLIVQEPDKTDFGIPHKPSFAVWKTFKKTGYYSRALYMYDFFNLPTDIDSMADIGCGPWGGIYWIQHWPKMYAVDPVWSQYFGYDMVKINSPKIQLIQGYTQNFTLPEPVDAMLSVNAINHGGDIQKSLENMMANIKVGGRLYFHIHLRAPHQLDSAHPMPLTEDDIMPVFEKHKIIKTESLNYDPTKPNKPNKGNRVTFVAEIEKI